MSKQLVEQKQVFSFLEKALEKSKQQDAAMEAVLEHMKMLHDNVFDMKTEVNERFVEMNILVQEVRDSVTLSNSECADLQSAVGKKSVQLTKERFEPGDDFLKLVGKNRNLIWKKLKQKFNVHKYIYVRRIDFQEALEFVKAYKPEKYI
ncbi:ORF6C domain-containing protein [Paenibacillus sp. 1P03SA]|uniref:ORF6C domain-containing protein n=1 Tax=Paenibacillus sp. 1P03SA TaxID=3132294 RepID=UPI00399FE783